MGVWDIVAAAWTQNSYRALAFLLSNMDESLTPLIALAEDAQQAWAILEGKFDRKAVTNLHTLLKDIFKLKSTNKREVSGHMAKYVELWQQFTVRTRTPPKDNECSENQLRPCLNR